MQRFLHEGSIWRILVSMDIHHPDSVSESTPREMRERSGLRRRPGGRNARIQAAVFEATLSLLEEKGYEALSFASIAERAGVHEATLYRHWKTKEQLVLDAATHRVADAIPVPDTGSFRSDLVAILQFLRTFLHSAIGQALIQTAVATVHIPQFCLWRRDLWRQRRADLQVLFDRALVRGECSPQIDAQLFLETLIGILYLRLFVVNEPLDETLPERVVDLMLAGGGLP